MTTLLLIGKVNPRVRERLTGRFDIMELPSAKAEDITAEMAAKVAGTASFNAMPASIMDALPNLQIIANCAPIGFEAEFVGQRGHNTLYRGILMPLSSDGEAIDFIYGVINWKEMADSAIVASLVDEVDRAAAVPPAAAWADGPSGASAESDIDADTLSLWPEAADGLADRLAIARDSAEEADASAGRSRAAL